MKTKWLNANIKKLYWIHFWVKIRTKDIDTSMSRNYYKLYYGTVLL